MVWRELRACGRFSRASVYRSLKETQPNTIARRLQAINRICCRRVIDAEGSCPPADIYIMLPQDTLGDAIWHRIVAISFVEARIEYDKGIPGKYAVACCRSGG
jgi:hypothetical protein